jgi:hypothetical protein
MHVILLLLVYMALHSCAAAFDMVFAPDAMQADLRSANIDLWQLTLVCCRCRVVLVLRWQCLSRSWALELRQQ